MADTKFKQTPIELEPKRENRFILEFPSEFGIESYLVQTVSKPRLTYHDKNNYTWGHISIEMLDVAGELSPSVGLLKIIDHCKNKKNKFSNKGVTDPNKQVLFIFTIKDLDPTGITIETWTIKVKEVVSVSFGENDYGSSELQKIKLVIEPLNCSLG